MSRPTRRPATPRAPWDPITGLRVGAFTGGLLGGVGALVTDLANAWWVFVGAAVGGTAGYWSEKREQRHGPTR